MKNVRLLLVSLLLALPLLGQAQQELFKKYSDRKNVSSVYISKAMLEMNPSLFTKDIYIGKAASQLNSVQIVSTMDKMIKSDLLKDIRELVKSSRYELLMKQKGTVSSSEFYVSRKGDKVKELIMVTNGAAEVRLPGRGDDDQGRAEHPALPEYQWIRHSFPRLSLGRLAGHGYSGVSYRLEESGACVQLRRMEEIH